MRKKKRKKQGSMLWRREWSKNIKPNFSASAVKKKKRKKKSEHERKKSKQK